MTLKDLNVAFSNFFNTLVSNQCYNGNVLSEVLEILITIKSVDVDRKIVYWTNAKQII